MGFLKLIGVVGSASLLASCLTFFATRQHYLAVIDPANTGHDYCAQPAMVVARAVEMNTAGSPRVQGHLGESFESNVEMSSPKQKAGGIEYVIKQREAQQQHINSFRQFIAAEHSRSLIDEAAFRYEAESINYEWAAVQEDKLFSAFLQKPALAAFVPSHMSCRASTCKVNIPSQDDASAEAAYQAVLHTLASEEVNQSVTYFRDPKKGEVVMYISQQEKSFFK